MKKTLENGYSVLVYPEGTTHIEPRTRDFKRGAFRLAAEQGFPILPMTIEYLDDGDAWIGNDTFVPHFIRCFGKKNTYVKIRYGEPISGNNADQLLHASKIWIDENLFLLRRAYDKKDKTPSSL